MFSLSGENIWRCCLCGKNENKTSGYSRISPKNEVRNKLFIWKKIMKKYLDILVFTLLFFFIFSYFSWKQTEVALTGVQFSSLSESYKVPAGIQVQVVNNSLDTFSFNSCQDLVVRHTGQALSFPESLCEDIVLTSRESKIIDFSGYYTLFENPGNYTFVLSQGEKEYIQQVEVAYRGTIGKIFVGLFYAPLYNLLVYLIQFFGNSLGLAIVTITILIRILLLFPQHKMMVSQRKMQAIQPKIKKIQETHKGDQQTIGMELMKLYKTEGVNPMGSCGLLLIQMPILLVIYQIIIHITSLKNEFYIYDFIPEFHISQIDFNFLWMNLLGAGGTTGILLALTVAAIQFIQVKLSLVHKTKDDTKKWVVLEKKKGASEYNSFMPDPEMMNKFMLYGMPAMVGVFTYTIIAWVGLYWGVSTLFAILQQLFVNKIIKK